MSVTCTLLSLLLMNCEKSTQQQPNPKPGVPVLAPTKVAPAATPIPAGPVPTPDASPVALPSSTPIFSGEPPQVLQGWLSDYSMFAERRILNQHPELLNVAASRMNVLCPKWESLESSERQKFWSSLLWAIAQPESGHNRTLIYRETTMSKDSVTGLQIRSEGLLQLSYSDVKNYHYPWNDISWEKDREMALKDYETEAKLGNQKRTLLNAYANLNLGLWIMARLLENHPFDRVESTLSAYWSTLNVTKKTFQKVMDGLKNKEAVCCPRTGDTV